MCFRLGWLLLLATATGRRVVPALLLARAAAQKVVPIPRAQTLQVAGPVDEPTSIELRSALEVPDGGEAQLPIVVEPRAVSIEGDGAPRITKVGTDAPDGIYSSGQNITITLTFTSAVELVGDPRSLKLELATGCAHESCAVREQQSFTCKADYGEFALTLYDSIKANVSSTVPETRGPSDPKMWAPSGTARNVGALDDQELVKQKLETIDGIENVTVFFGDADDRDYSGGRRACTSKGNLIVITFERCSYADQFDGDVPELRLDATNAVLDPRTMLPVGDGVYLTGRTAGSTVFVDPVATELTKGVRRRNGLATYVSGNGTSTLTFVYDVVPGDAADPLEAVQLLDIHGDSVIVRAAAYPYALIDASLPPFKTAARYSSGTANALGASNDVIVDVRSPLVVDVTSPDVDGEYGVGAVLRIWVTFDRPLAIGGEPRLVMATGASNSYALFTQIINGGYTAEFEYTVGEGDANQDLDYFDINSLSVASPGYIVRRLGTLPSPQRPC